MSEDIKPPLGVRPEEEYKRGVTRMLAGRKAELATNRACEIVDAIKRYKCAGKPTPPEWHRELRRLTK